MRCTLALVIIALVATAAALDFRTEDVTSVEQVLEGCKAKPRECAAWLESDREAHDAKVAQAVQTLADAYQKPTSTESGDGKLKAWRGLQQLIPELAKEYFLLASPLVQDRDKEYFLLASPLVPTAIPEHLVERMKKEQVTAAGFASWNRQVGIVTVCFVFFIYGMGVLGGAWLVWAICCRRKN